MNLKRRDAALALRVAKAAQMEKGLRVLDVGCGTGQSLQLWHDQYHPSRLVGVTLSPAHAKYAFQRLPAEIHVFAADALQWMAKEISEKQHTFDRIVALDSAYHFNTRQLFFKCAFDLLAPGGRIALADVVLSTSIAARDRFILRLLLRFLGVPWANMITELDYLSQLEAIGFKHIIGDQDITSHVFPGAAAFLAGRSEDPAIRAVTKPSLWFGYRTFARVLKWWSHGNVVRYVVVQAQKPEASS